MAGLKRIILIDTHLPGVVELKLDGHTNICGTNASGKTTLQRLIPVFYGEYPSRVVPATRDSFEKWYLPRTSSFIIYEYTRSDDELCQAVLSSGGSGVNYRFIGKPFEIDDYLFEQKNQKHGSVSSIELARAMKRNDVLVTSQLNTKDFRAILQNDHSVLNQSSNARELLGYARIFSLCASQSHIRHMEKLAKAVHSKEGKMETIKAMIAAILEEDGVQPPTSNLSRHRVDDWLRECQLIKQFDKIRPEFTKLEQANFALTSAEQTLARLKHQFEQDKCQLAARVEQSKSELDDNQFARKKNDNQWYERRDALNQTVSAARADVEKFTSELEGVEKEYDNWQAEDIEQLRENVANLSQWQNELETVSGRYSLLTEKHQDIESAYARRLAEAGEKLSVTLEQLSAARQEAAEKRSTQQQQESETLHSINGQFATRQQSLSEAFQSRLSELKVTEAELRASVNNIGFNEFEQSQLDLMDASIKEATIHEDSMRTEYRQAQSRHLKLQQAREAASQSLEKARQQYQKEEASVGAVEQLLFPGEGSLLEYLRKNASNWEQTFGKVLRPELLQRNDLTPGLSDDDTSIFGITLATEVLETPAYAQSEKALKIQLQDAQQRQQNALEHQTECEQTLAKANEDVRNAELVLTQKDNLIRSAESARKRAQQDKDALLTEYQQALSERKQKAKTRLESNTQSQQKIKAQFELDKEELSDQLREAQTEHKFHWQQLIADTDAQVAQCDADIRKAKDLAASDRREMDAWLESELNNRGVDVDEIAQLKKRIKALKDSIYKTESQRHKVSDYERWYQTVFTGYKITWQNSLSDARKSLSEAERSLAQEHTAYRDTREQLGEAQQTLEVTLKTTSEQRDQVTGLLKTLAKLSLDTGDAGVQQITEDATVSQRLSQAQNLLQEREELTADVRSYVERFDQLIAAQAGTGLSDTWERARQECAVISAQGVKGIDHRRMVTHLAQLLNVIVPQKLQGLKEQGRIFGADLTQYYYVLADIDKRIVSQSRRITKEVDSELFLDGVTESAVKIRSRISELEFWPELEQFRALYDEWMGSGATELPDEEYGHSMRQVLDILGRAALTGGISKLLDIELHLREGNSDLIIRTDRQLNESSSHGMAYLILCKFLLAFTRLLRTDDNTTVHWPIDELGTLHQSNVKKIFDACQKNNICVVGAFPNPESDVLSLFENRYLIDKVSRKLQVVQPKTSAIAERIQSRRTQEEASA